MDAFGITTFCDDIRFEQLGKLSLIGCYGSDLIVFSELPVVLPKLCFFVQLRFPPVSIQSVKIKILIYFPGDEDDSPTFSQDLPPIPDDLKMKPKELPSDKDLVRQMSVNHNILISPLMLKQEGFIKVRVNINDQILRAGALKITKNLDIA
jgi:hypothetical protein